MTDSAVLDTVLGLVFLFYALALLCGGLVEMIANWVKKRAKYLLRGIQDLLDDISPEHGEVAVAENTGWDRMQNTAQTVVLNGKVESQRYDAMLQAEATTVLSGPMEAAAGEPARPPWRIGSQRAGTRSPWAMSWATR